MKDPNYNTRGYYPTQTNRGYYPNPTVGYQPNQNQNKGHIGKRLLGILTTVGLIVGGYVFIKSLPKNHGANVIPQMTAAPATPETYPTLTPEVVATPTPEPTVEPTATPEPVPVVVSNDDGYNRGDSVITTTEVRMRLNTNTKSFILGTVPGGSVVNRILSDGDWDLVRYGDQIAYVHTDYTNPYDVDYNNDYYRIEEYSDIARTTSGLNFRLGPSTSEKSIFLLEKNEEVVVIGRAIPYDNPSDEWLLVRARGKIGYVNKKYTKSLRSALESAGIAVGEVKVQKLGYLKNGTTVLNQNGNPSSSLEEWKLVEVLQTEGDYSLIHCNGVVGYVPSKSIKKLNGTFLSVNKGAQRICYYVNTDLVLRGKCTTGKKGCETISGCFTPYGKGNYYDFGHDGYAAKRLWMPFNGGQGLHDASWEDEKKFGDPNYTKNHGSLGCVRLPDDIADFIYENVSRDTTVLVYD